MQIEPLKLAGTYSVTLAPISDERGYFVTTYLESAFHAQGIEAHWVQENQSLSRRKGVLRGLHFQAPPHAQAKLVRVLSGVVLDVWVDIRKDSPTYGQWDSIELDAQRHSMVYIAQGFAHAFLTLTEDTIVLYKVDSPYAPQSEGGLLWNDPILAIPWPLDEPQLSQRDQRWPTLAEFDSPFYR
ncbi:MAG: dTDP-4-dehydrorhamnose 3,5-epimerase [Chloroflexi bacterium]|nr:dTDP-4-dehydrorhamnose 3,5-epimerase [Chloroflexota bacterium]